MATGLEWRRDDGLEEMKQTKALASTATIHARQLVARTPQPQAQVFEALQVSRLSTKTTTGRASGGWRGMMASCSMVIG